jgi:hypothetical protein
MEDLEVPGEDMRRHERTGQSVCAAAGELLDQLADHVLGVTEEHPGPL